MQQILSDVVPLGGPDSVATTTRIDSVGICFEHAWDSAEARVSECFLPAVLFIPAILAGVIVLGQILRLTILWQPRWLRPFVEENIEPALELGLVPRRQWSVYTVILAVSCTLTFSFRLAIYGLGFSLAHHDMSLLMPPVTWLVTLLEALVFRPRTVPYSILCIAVAEIIVESMLFNRERHTIFIGLPIASVVFGAIAILAVLCMPFRDPRLPSKDISKPLTASTSVLRSPEDSVNLWQFLTVAWMKPLMDIGNSRQLQDMDVWSLPYEFQHRRLHEHFRQLKGSVLYRLLTANGIDLMIITVFGVLDLLSQYAGPIFLQLILKSMEDGRPKKVTLTYAALGLCVRLLAAQLGVLSTWFGRRSYERSRGEMITMLYEKTLGRKIAFASPELKETKSTNNGDGDDTPNGYMKEESSSWWRRIAQIFQASHKRIKSPAPAKQPAVMGKILNLMRNDVYEVAQRLWEFDIIVQKPVGVILSATLVVNYLGWASIISVLLVVLAQVIGIILARVMVYYEKKRRFATDAKLQVISEFVEAIRHLRWYGWQDAWLERILSARQKELVLRVISAAWGIVITFFNALSLDAAPLAAFAAYIMIEKKPLTIDIAFPARQLLAMLTFQLRDVPRLIVQLINAWVALGRIEDFMAEPDLEHTATEALIGDELALHKASFAWPGVDSAVIREIDLAFTEGLTVICGEVGSGKTALLQALLGELDLVEGQLIRPAGAIGYCAQTPWLQSMSIRENILFSAPYDDKRYRDVLDSCALTPDLAEFKAGDLSLIGENGIGLSGGQRARVALARAVYSNNSILLLDDPLAALDQQTAEAIVRSCIDGPLLRGRTVVLVTHRTDLVLHIATKVVRIENDGRASIVDQDSIVANHSLKQTRSNGSEADSSEALAAKQKAAAVPDKFIEDEQRAHGGIQARVYWEYIKAGSLRYWAVTVVVLIFFRLLTLGESWFVKTLGEAYGTEKASFSTSNKEVTYGTSGLFDGLPPPQQNIKPWFLVLFLLTFGQTIAFVFAQIMVQVIVYTAAKNMFSDIMVKVAYATFRFYDVTPVGRLMNRMTSDIGVIDGGISWQFFDISWMLIGWVSSIVVIASIAPSFLVCTAILVVLFVVIYRRFIPTSQNLRRLEMVSLTPLMSNFGELLNGLATVRAFCAQMRFQDRVIHVVDSFQKMDHFYWSLQAWLMYRYDILAALASFLLNALALATNLSPGLTAFALSSATRFVLVTHGLCKEYGQLQMEFVSVERVVELLHLEQEPKGTVSPPAWWPSFSGDIVFKDVTIKYAPHLDPALSNVTFTVKGGSKTAVIGRTGSGKSTLALAMLATILPDVGNILVDSVDLAEVDKQLLRTRVTFLAQDPILFPGTMRQNLDPVMEHTDEECEVVLRRVCERQGWALDTNVEAGGKNLSQGQRQLVGLARAVLRRSAIIILDEATASIDRETAAQIQQVMYEEMRDSTVITIAHRLEAVRDADYCIVLGKGKILQQGPAADMLNDHKREVLENVDEDSQS